MLDYRKLLDSNDSFLLEKNVVKELSCAMPESLVFSTSGSMGTAKHIAISRAALRHSARAVNLHLQANSESCWGLVLPWWHVGGMGVIVRSSVSHSRLAQWDEKWNAQQVSKWLIAQRVTHLSLVPTQLYDLVAARIQAPHCLIAVIVGGGKLDYQLGVNARALGWPVLVSYGMTEAASQIATQELSALDTPFSHHGMRPLSCWQVQANQMGIIEIRGSALFHGYLTNNATCYQAREGEWFSTADRGKITGDELEILGRDDELIKILGELVSPIQIENKLLALGLAPSSIGLIPLTNERRGYELHLVYDVGSKQQVMNALALYHLSAAGYAKITHTHAVTTMPLSDLGKIIRHELYKICTDQREAQ